MKRTATLLALQVPLAALIALISLALIALTAAAPLPAAAQCNGDVPDVTGCWEMIEKSCVTIGGLVHWTPAELGFTRQLEFRGDGTMTCYQDLAPLFEGTWRLEFLYFDTVDRYYWCFPESEPFDLGQTLNFIEGGLMAIGDYPVAVDAGCGFVYAPRGEIVAEGSDTWGEVKAIYR